MIMAAFHHRQADSTSSRPASLRTFARNLSVIFVLASATLGSAAGGNALSFGGDDFVTRSAVSTATDNFTMQAWVNWTGSSGQPQMIMVNGDTGARGYCLYIAPATNKPRILCGGITEAEADYVMPTGVWRHVAVVREASTWKLYIDGVSQTLSLSLPDPNSPLETDVTRVGANQGGTEGYSGSVDEFSFWNAALSETTINSWMNKAVDAGHPNYASLICYWQFNEGTGQVAGDSSSSANSGQLGSTSGSETSDPSWITSSAPVPVTLSGFELE